MRMYNYNILLYLFATCIFNVLKIYMRVLYMYYICVRLKLEEIKLIKFMYIYIYGLI